MTQSGTHANQTPERKAIYKLFTILFKERGKSRKVNRKVVVAAASKVNPNLKNQKLEDRMKDVVECTATRLLNGICHIWSNDMDPGNDTAFDKDNTNDMVEDDQLNEARRVLEQEEAMANVVVQDDCIDMGSDDTNEVGAQSDSSIHKYCVTSPWVDGAKIMAEKNYVAVKKVSDERKERKRIATRFIVNKVKEMRSEESTSIGCEMEVVAPSPWTAAVHGLEPRYYRH